VNHTHFPKETHLPYWAHRGKKRQEGWSCRLGISIYFIGDKVRSPFQETQTAEGEVKKYIPDRGIGFKIIFYNRMSLLVSMNLSLDHHV